MKYASNYLDTDRNNVNEIKKQQKIMINGLIKTILNVESIYVITLSS